MLPRHVAGLALPVYMMPRASKQSRHLADARKRINERKKEKGKARRGRRGWWEHPTADFPVTATHASHQPGPSTSHTPPLHLMQPRHHRKKTLFIYVHKTKWRDTCSDATQQCFSIMLSKLCRAVSQNGTYEPLNSFCLASMQLISIKHALKWCSGLWDLRNWLFSSYLKQMNYVWI